jgi:16S rRNA (guanine1516-N2)-methyltransferase
MTHTCAILDASLESMPTALSHQLTQLNLPVADDEDAADYVLKWDEDTLVLKTRTGDQLRAALKKPAFVNAKQPFNRALAPVRNGTVIDATAGLGGDSLQLARMADKVISIERHPVVFALLISALHKAIQDGWSAAEKIEPLHGNASDIIPHLPASDVIFLDPMFPPKRKSSALPPKSVRLLRTLVGEDLDEDELLTVARRHAVRRIVVKRQLHAPLMASDSLAIHEGKVVRYEVYAPAGDWE